ncbi:glycerophosphodiester phosphodiesterase family protein [Actinotignum sp. GS-2025b]|uniref:glycerophosphodiester phosphodiesterase family protein n=1 Tax=Actinotignum sp. GS-2025b TaxID=3427275 RepID=UPI003F448E6F
MGRLYDIDGPALIIAHRGGGNEYPENSLRAFEALYRAGFRHIESDVHATADGVAVILHDPLLDRTTDGVGPISAHTWAEVAQVRNEAGERPPRLDEVLDAFPDAVFNLDAKSDAAVEPLVAAVRRTGAAGRVCLASFSQARVERMRSRLPGATFSLGRSAVAWLMALSHLPGVQGSTHRQIPRFAARLPGRSGAGRYRAAAPALATRPSLVTRPSLAAPPVAAFALKPLAPERGCGWRRHARPPGSRSHRAVCAARPRARAGGARLDD